METIRITKKIYEFFRAAYDGRIYARLTLISNKGHEGRDWEIATLGLDGVE